MVQTRGGHRYRPMIHTRSPARDATGTSRVAADTSPVQGAEAPPYVSPATTIISNPASTDILEEPHCAEPPSRLYNTRVGPRPPSHVHPRPPRRAPPSKRARTSGPGESSRSRPEPSQSLAAQCPARSSPQLSPASRIRRPLFHCDPIPGNVDCRAKDIHGEFFYDIPALTTDPRFRDSMRLVHRYLLLPFMAPRQFF